MEYVSPEGLRLDGRRPMEMRQIRAEIGIVSKADGSAIFEMGNTRVIAAVYGPREVQNRSQQMSDQALVRCEYNMANFSTGDRMRKSKCDRRSTEISLVIRQTMEACILTHLMPRSQMDSKLPIDILENVMQLAIEGCKAIANYIREILLENTKQLEYRQGV